MFEHKKIFILGMARSGYEAAKLLAKHHNQIFVTDKSEQDPKRVEELKKLGVSVVITNDPCSYLDDTYDFVVKNPGIRVDHPIVLKAKELKIPVTNEVEVAYSFKPEGVKIIAITGSNGKTTTTTLTYNFLKQFGVPVHLGGNIGYPVCSLIEITKQNDIWVLEISGHQLHDIIHFKTDIAVLTNLSEVHIDHFGTYENYKYNKCRVFEGHSENDTAIINIENEDSVISTKDIASKKICFSSKKEADLCIKEDAIYYFDEKVVDLKDIKLKGRHNYENIMCAIAASKEFGIDNKSIYQVLTNFYGVEHRIEFVKEVNGRQFYNDSKATNVKSTQIALSAFSNPTILLLGGLDRGHSFEELTEYLKNTKHIFCFGETKQRIKEYADSINIACTVVENVKEAVKGAYDISEVGDVILLSPACASWDQYKCFEDRGNDFKVSVNEL